MQVRSRGEQVQHLALNHQSVPHHTAQLLKVLWHCAGAGDEVSCRAPTTFAYEDEGEGLRMGPLAAFGEGFSERSHPLAESARTLVDLDQDGHEDLVAVVGRTLEVKYGGGSRTATFDIPAGERYSARRRLVRFADLDRDDYPDVLYFMDDRVVVSYGTGAGFTDSFTIVDTSLGTEGAGAAEKSARHVDDVDGDGVLDILVFTTTDTRVAYGSGGRTDAFGSPVRVSRDFGTRDMTTPNAARRWLLDLDADGYPDLVRLDQESARAPGRLHVAFGSSDGFAETQALPQTGGASGGQFGVSQALLATRTFVQPCNVNGDAYVDLAFFSGTRGTYVALGAGRAFEAPRQWAEDFPGATYSTQQYVAAQDLNGDGLDDFVRVHGRRLATLLNPGQRPEEPLGLASFEFVGPTAFQAGR
ncbi:MAG: VCBS repeat-containing protein, partial [Candidatus Devosia euplotis]|nr:VCBS repeat-containing protein [Candidatus Devosia euplotis]